MDKKDLPRSYSRRNMIKTGAMICASATLIEKAAAADAAGSQNPDQAGGIRMTDTTNNTATLLTVERREHVVLLGINRPADDNRIDPQTYSLLAEAYYQYEHDPSLRAAVLFGHGSHFSKGIDVAAFAPLISSGDNPLDKSRMIDPWGKTKPVLSKPVVVVAHGDTWNLGHELCLAADIRVAAANARFAQTENTQARMPGSGATVRFVRDAGWGQAMRYLLTGDFWDAQQAKSMGLFQDIAATPEAALELGIQLATKIAACAPLSVKMTLASAHLAIDEGEEKALFALNAQRKALYTTQDFQENLKAHAENRPPIYHGD
jgi:enoyl-CoA hydratase/carnithine racemase